MDIDRLRPIVQDHRAQPRTQPRGEPVCHPLQAQQPGARHDQVEQAQRPYQVKRLPAQRPVTKQLHRAQPRRTRQSKEVAGDEGAIGDDMAAPAGARVNRVHRFAPGQRDHGIGTGECLPHGIDRRGGQQWRVGGGDDNRPVPAAHRIAHAISEVVACFDQLHGAASRQAGQFVIDRVERFALYRYRQAGDARVRRRDMKDMADQRSPGQRGQAGMADREPPGERALRLAALPGENDQPQPGLPARRGREILRPAHRPHPGSGSADISDGRDFRTIMCRPLWPARVTHT